MKHTLFILALITATIQTFAQSPRIKLNQITKDSVTGSVLISSPTDSGMIYSRDLFISYGADTVLILNGDTLAATSGIISSVLSDGVTITGNGTTGSELTVDTATVIATKQDLDLYYLDSNPDGYTSNTGTVTSVGGTGTVNGISLSGTVTSSGDLTLGGTLSGVDLASQVTGTLPVANGGTGSASQNFVDLTTTQTVGGAKTFTSALTQSGGDVNFDSGTLFVDEDVNRVGIGTSSPQGFLSIEQEFPSSTTLGFTISDPNYTGLFQVFSNASGFFLPTFEGYTGPDANNGSGTYYPFGIGIVGSIDTIQDVYNSNFALVEIQGREYDNFPSGAGLVENANIFNINNAGAPLLTVAANGDTGIGTTSPSYKLDVNGNVRADTYYYDVTSTLQSSSDSRLKQNISDMDNVLDKLKELELVKYEWNENMYKKLEGRTSQSKLGGTFQGMIAQQVESLFPQYVGEDADGYKTLSYVSFVIPLLKGFQEQQTIIETQATEIEQLKTLITELSNRLTILENN